MGESQLKKRFVKLPLIRTFRCYHHPIRGWNYCMAEIYSKCLILEWKPFIFNSNILHFLCQKLVLFFKAYAFINYTWLNCIILKDLQRPFENQCERKNYLRLAQTLPQIALSNLVCIHRLLFIIVRNCHNCRYEKIYSPLGNPKKIYDFLNGNR